MTKIGIFDSDSTVLTPHPSPELIDACIERECARRVFWLIYISDCFGWMLYRRVRLATESQMNLRLPIDETSFEISPLTAVPGNGPSLFRSNLRLIFPRIHDETESII